MIRRNEVNMFKFEDYGIELDMLVIAIAAILVILVVLSIVLIAKQSKLKKRYEAFMSGQDGKSLEESFNHKFENMDLINQEIDIIKNRLDGIDANLMKTYQKIGIVKYDAFKEIGGTLSFVLALLTKENDGFLINSMHSNREGCYTYVKEVKKGEVFVTLSDEETQALEEAKNQQ